MGFWAQTQITMSVIARRGGLALIKSQCVDQMTTNHGHIQFRKAGVEICFVQGFNPKCGRHHVLHLRGTF